jgi:hypothetical protein
MGESGRLFLVARVGWSTRFLNAQTHFYPAWRDRPGEDRRFVPVIAFAVREKAEARARELELEAARLFNPFWRFGPLSALTSLTESELRRRLCDLVGSIPNTPLRGSTGAQEWSVWWAEQSPGWSDEVLAAVWTLFDAVRFYAVLEINAE